MQSKVLEAVSNHLGVRRLSRLLLGDAVDTAAPSEQRASVEQFDIPAWVGLFEDFLRHGIVRIAEATKNYGVITDLSLIHISEPTRH